MKFASLLVLFATSYCFQANLRKSNENHSKISGNPMNSKDLKSTKIKPEIQPKAEKKA